MSCSLYNVLPRECAEKFEEVINISNFDICDSDMYKECPFYRYINEPEELCEYADKCLYGKTIWTSPFKRIMQVSKTYCFSKNKVNCERYKLMKTGKNPPEGLRVDGSKVELKT